MRPVPILILATSHTSWATYKVRNGGFPRESCGQPAWQKFFALEMAQLPVHQQLEDTLRLCKVAACQLHGVSGLVSLSLEVKMKCHDFQQNDKAQRLTAGIHSEAK